MNNLPSLPTDNLYKFYFIAGISIIVLSIGLLINQTNLLNEKRNKLDLEILKADYELDIFKEKHNEIKDEIDEMKSESIMNKRIVTSNDSFDLIDFKRNIFNDLEYRKYLEFIANNEDFLFPERKKAELIKNKVRDINLYHHKQIFNISLLKLRLNERNTLINNLYFLWFIVIFFVLLGIIMTVYGHKKWYELVQKPLDEKLRIELELLKNPEVNQ